MAKNWETLVPAGGTTGQALTKKTNTDGDTQWATVGGAITTVSGALGADITCTSASFADVMQLSLTAGTWLILVAAQVLLGVGGTTARGTVTLGLTADNSLTFIDKKQASVDNSATLTGPGLQTVAMVVPLVLAAPATLKLRYKTNDTTQINKILATVDTTASVGTQMTAVKVA